MTIAQVIELADRVSPPPHPGSSYLSFPQPHEPLPKQSTLDQLGIKDGATLRRFSRRAKPARANTAALRNR
jgi:hypothetical protein